MTTAEQWRWIPDWEGVYEVSDQARVRSHHPRWKHSRLLRPYLKDGYYKVTLTRDGKESHVRLHRVMALAFFGEPEPGQVCRHLNDVRTDCRLSNLAWGSPTENMLDVVANGNHHQASRTHCRRGHELTAENTAWHTNHNGRPTRRCRTCQRQRTVPIVACDSCGAQLRRNNMHKHRTVSCAALASKP